MTLAGIVLAGIGTIPFALAGSHPGIWFLCAGLVVRGAGLGAATIALMAGAFQGLPKPDVPHASSTTRIMQQVGGAFGAAVLVVILATQGGGHGASPAALAAAFGHTFWWCVGFTALAVLPALLMPGRPGRPRARRHPSGRTRRWPRSRNEAGRARWRRASRRPSPQPAVRRSAIMATSSSRGPNSGHEVVGERFQVGSRWPRWPPAAASPCSRPGTPGGPRPGRR